jgi:1-aminocyclopropane-1-carboxylate deaminase/D-cysteine desulfhydrase-like pyridoxal-dependent ACC family enzyme
MKFTGIISPVHQFDDIWVKREDLAHFTSLEFPSGSKVRQYMAMTVPKQLIGEHGYWEYKVPPCIVGCSSNSAMQVYVAAAAKQLNTKGIIYTAKRKVRSDATLYAEKMGAEIVEVKPGYLSVIRKATRQRVIDLKHVVEWDRRAAIQDTIDQCANIPEGVKRIIVPTGSGLTAAGVIIGLSRRGLGGWPHTGPIVVAVLTSPMTDHERILKLVGHEPNPVRLQTIDQSTPYDIPVVESLPDGTPLDCFYAAKAWKYVRDGDCLWPPGLRPVISMPEICQQKFKDWKGPTEWINSVTYLTP